MRLLGNRNDRRARQRMFTAAQLVLTLGVCLLLCLCGGCYDGHALVERARSAVLKSRDAEIDLGTYHTTMPRDPQTNAFTTLQVHVFGTAPRYHVSAIKKQLAADEFRLRHGTLTAIRGTTRAELAEPDLTIFRARIEKVVNDILADAPVKTIGFHDIQLQYDEE